MEINVSVRIALPQGWLISQPGLKRVKKNINRMTFSLSVISITIHIHILQSDRQLGKNAWMVRNTKIHKEFVIEINQIEKDIYA